MTNVEDIGLMLEMMETNYGQRFYDGVDKEKVVKWWAFSFRNDDKELVMQGVLSWINTMPYKPTVADIRKRMSEIRLKGQMTEIEAWQKIRKAIDASGTRNGSLEAFRELPPILRKLVGEPTQLRNWYRCSDDTLEGVISSNVQRSYRKTAQDESDYYSLPSDLQRVEQWRIDVPSIDELPEPKKEKTVDDIYSEMEQKTKEYRERYGLKPNPEYEDRVANFLNGAKGQ